MGQKMYFYELFKPQWKSSTNPIWVTLICKWVKIPFPLQSILSYVFASFILWKKSGERSMACSFVVWNKSQWAQPIQSWWKNAYEFRPNIEKQQVFSSRGIHNWYNPVCWLYDKKCHSSFHSFTPGDVF